MIWPSEARRLLPLWLLCGLGLTSAAAVAAAEAGGSVRRELYLVRHGAYDAADPRDAHAGKALTPLGVAQARLLGSRLRGLPFAFDAVLASPMTRARETASVAAAELGLAVRLVPDLAECTPPTRRADIMARERPEDLLACAAQFERLATELLRPAAAPAGGAVAPPVGGPTASGATRRELVVCHGNVIRSLVTRALAVDPEAWLGMSIGHASLTRIAVEADGAIRVISVGDVGHLPPNLQSGAFGDPERELTATSAPR